MGSEPDTKPKDTSIFINVAAALFYGAVSIASTFFNKAVLTVYHFNFTAFLLLTQLIFQLIVLEGMKASKLISYPQLNLQRGQQLLPVALLYSINVMVSLSALNMLNVPMYGVLKRLTILFALVGEYYFLKKTTSWQLKQSVFVIVSGAIIAGLGDLTFDLFGYCFAFLSCFAQAAYLIYVAKSGVETGVNSFGLLSYNSLLSLPFVSLFALVNGDIEGVMNYEQMWNSNFQLCFWTNLVLSSLLNYSLFLCTTVNSPLTTTIMGQLKNALSILLGLFLLGGVEITPLNLFGFILNTFGGFWYSIIKYQEKEKKIPRTEEKQKLIV